MSFGDFSLGDLVNCFIQKLGSDLAPWDSPNRSGKVTHNGRLLIKWAVAKVSAIFWRSRYLLEVLKIWRSLDEKRKATKREDRIMRRKACPIALRLHRKIKQRCRLNMVRVSTSTTWRRLREAGPNGSKPSYYLHHKWAVLFDRLCSISIFIYLRDYWISHSGCPKNRSSFSTFI